MSQPTVLAAGDDFVLSEMFAEDVLREVPGARVSRLDLPWPHQPFHSVAEVDEASGDEAQLIAALQGVRACVTQMAPLTEAVLDACPDLELFAVSRGGPVNANLSAAREHGVTVTAAPGRNAVATAEHTIAMILAAMRRLTGADRSVQEGRWDSSLYAFDAVGYELAGATVGLIGAGAIGSRVARILTAFEASVIIHDPYADPHALPDGSRLVDLDDLLADSQVVSLHARVTDETREILSRRRIEAMRPGAVLVNCARGALLDYAAAADALQTGHLYAAAFDVFDIEPLPADHPLRSAPNVVLTPHVGGASRQVARRASRMAAAEVARWADDLPPLHPAA